jgi:hypothetical protein
MKCLSFSALVVCGGLACLLSACASTPDSADKKVESTAPASCEVVGSTTGSYMSHRVCAPTAVPAEAKNVPPVSSVPK